MERVAELALRETLKWAGAQSLDTTPYPVQMARIEAAVAAQEPITFLLPAFPAKSANREKTIGDAPDFGDVAALARLNAFCRKLGEIHEPGARLLLASDGRVFGATVGIREESITEYQHGIEVSVARLGLDRIDTHTLEDAFGTASSEELRDRLLALHGDDPVTLREEVLRDPTRRSLFDGLHRFLFEDAAAREPGRSRSAIRKEQKTLAYEVLRRSDAWSRYLGAHFPKAVRLSIHPQRPRLEDGTVAKLPFRLLPGESPWATPWHRAPMWDGRGLRLVRRSEADSLHAELVHVDGIWPCFAAGAASMDAEPVLAEVCRA